MTETTRQLGRYELFRRIAKGGMGEIYLAKTRGVAGFEKTVIIKTILPHLAEEEEFVAKFLDEGHIVTKLSHGNIVPVFDMGEEDGEYFMAMEYVPGRDLRAVLKELAARGQAMPVEIALHVTAELCKGLGYAHRKTDDQGSPLEIVHRDVSPSNVLISREGEVKVIDFGIARAAGRLSKTVSGRIQGKFCYMSPEQASGKPLDHRSDVFSTGVVLYEMLTTTRPFEGDSDLETLDRVRECTFDPPSVLNPEVDDELDAIVCKALERDPEARYASIDELQVELVHYLFGLGQTVTGQQVSRFLCELFPEAAPPRDPDEEAREQALDLEAALNLELERLGLEPSESELEIAHTRTDAAGRSNHTGPVKHTAKHTATLGPEALPNTPTTSPEPPHTVARTAGEGLTDTSSDSLTSLPLAARATAQRGRNTIVLIGALLALLVLGVMGLQQLQTPTGTVRIESDPPGARILVNGAQLIGVTTPHELDLAAGAHSIQLSLEAYEPRTFRVQVEKGTRLEFAASEARLTPINRPTPQPPRTFTVETTPPQAILTANGELLGPTPHRVEVAPGEVLNLSASMTGCAPARYALSYGHASSTVLLELTCEESDPSRAASAEAILEPIPRPVTTRQNNGPGEASARRNVQRRIRIESTPPGATVHIDGVHAGQTPLWRPVPAYDEFDIELNLDGHRAARRSLRSTDLDDGRLHVILEKDVRGCLDFRAISPAYNELAINGRWLAGRHMKLESYPLPAGRHRLTVRNPEAEREETFTVEIEPGDTCTHLVVWER